MRILITGATGFVGKHLVKALNQTPHQLTLLVRNRQKEQVINLLEQLNAEILFLDQTDWKVAVKNAKPEVVLHLASFLTSSDDEQAIESLIDSNLTFGTHLLDSLDGLKIKYFINTGSFAEYKDNNAKLNPTYLYAATKTAFRSIISYYQSINEFKIVNVIPYTIYGGIDTKKKLIDYIYDSIFTQVPLKMSPGEQVLDFIHIEDVVDFYLQLLNHLALFTENYLEVHLGTGKGTTPKEIAKMIDTIAKDKTKIEWGGIPYRKRDTMYSVADKNLPQEFMSWTPSISLLDGLEKYIELIEKHTNNGI